MGLLSSLKLVIYEIVVRSRILYYLLPVLKDFYTKIILDPKKVINLTMADDKGKSRNFSVTDHRLYPPFGVDRIRTFQDIRIRKDDVIICGYPKSGCHWSYEIAYMLTHGKVQLTQHGKLWSGMLDILPDWLLDSLPSPRILNTHYRFESLPHQVKEKKNKIIFTIRNPKDTVVSFYNHSINLPIYGYSGEFDSYFKMFMEGNVDYGSYYDFNLSWDKHIKNPTTNEILVISYEELQSDPLQGVKKMAKFLEVDVSDSFAEEVMEGCSMRNMKDRRKGDQISAKLFRKGIVGDWKNWLTDEQSAAMDKVWQERMSQCTYQPEY